MPSDRLESWNSLILRRNLAGSWEYGCVENTLGLLLKLSNKPRRIFQVDGKGEKRHRKPSGGRSIPGAHEQKILMRGRS